jgi:hypothetical protein
VTDLCQVPNITVLFVLSSYRLIVPILLDVLFSEDKCRACRVVILAQGNHQQLLPYPETMDLLGGKAPYKDSQGLAPLPMPCRVTAEIRPALLVMTVGLVFFLLVQP